MYCEGYRIRSGTSDPTRIRLNPEYRSRDTADMIAREYLVGLMNDGLHVRWDGLGPLRDVYWDCRFAGRNGFEIINYISFTFLVGNLVGSSNIFR